MTTTRIHPASLAALLIGALCIGSLAAEPGSYRAEMFKQIDTNGDGVLSPEEIAAAKLQRAQRIDANQDGYISVEELEAHRQLMQAERMQRRMQKLDTNQDGRVSVEEFAAGQHGWKGRRGGDGAKAGGRGHWHGPKHGE